MIRLRWSIIVFLGVLALSIAISAGSALIDQFRGTTRWTGQVIGLAWVFAAYSVLAIGVAALLDAKRTIIAITAAAAFSISLACFAGAIIIDIGGNWRLASTIAETGALVLVPGLVSLHGGLLLLVPLRSWASKRTRQVAIVSGILFGALLFASLIVDGDWDEVGGDLLELIAGVAAAGFAIIGFFSTISTPAAWLLEHLARQRSSEGGLTQAVPVRVLCPRCGSSSEAPANQPHRCSACKLQIRVTLEEPRCRCGYLLYDLKTESCPECGRDIPPEMRWESQEAQPVEGGPPEDHAEGTRDAGHERDASERTAPTDVRSPDPSLGDRDAPPAAEGDAADLEPGR